jgi:Raf kinase inhibitor-like YbhB/YbcL family protein
MFTITSSAFDNGDTIPVKYSQEGHDISPDLQWQHVPGGTMELVLICEDPDAPRAEPFVHWLAYGIDPALNGLPEDLPKLEVLKHPILLQGLNSSGTPGYTGPLPPVGHGWHRYQFHLYALSEPVRIHEGAEVHEVRKAIKGKILEEALLLGRYIRGPEPVHEKAAAPVFYED